VNRSEYLAVLATEPATPDQRGAVMREFGRLGFTAADRAERLASAAAILDLPELGSIKDLVMGQAGQLLRVLQGCAIRADLPGPTSPTEHQRRGWLRDLFEIITAAPGKQSPRPASSHGGLESPIIGS
jgi:hypothetical protein